MAVNILNKVPDDLSEAHSPYRPVQLSLKTTTGGTKINPDSIKMMLAYSAFVFDGVNLPTAQDFPTNTISLATVEGKLPEASPSSATIVSTNLVIVKGASDLNPSIYKVSTPIDGTRSALLRLRFQVDYSWVSTNPDWTSETDVVAPYLGIEFGPSNKGLFVFLRDDGGTGELVFGGPSYSIGAPKPGETAVAFPWLSVPDGDPLELLLAWDFYTGNVTIYSYLPGVDDYPSELTSIQIAAISEFPTFGNGDGELNNRVGPTDQVTMYFGNVGGAGSTLTIEDWGLYTDLRKPIEDGVSQGRDLVLVAPDCPSELVGTVKPSEVKVGRWLPLDAEPEVDLFYRAGVNRAPQGLSIDKSDSALVGLKKEDSFIGARFEGFMVEAVMSEDLTTGFGDTSGAGFEVDDASKRYKLVLLDNGVRKTIGLCKNQTLIADFTDGYHLPSDDIDSGSMNLYRLLVDRLNSRVLVLEDWTPVISKTTGDTFPNTSGGTGEVRVGHLEEVPTECQFKLEFLNVFPSYGFWNSVLNLLPTSVSLPADVRFTEVSSGASLQSDGTVTITSFYGAQNYYHKSMAKSQTATAYNAVVDFSISTEQISFPTYSERGGSTGIGIELEVGGKILQFRLLDCGLHGRKIGIVPGSGLGIVDLYEQTALGKEFSAFHDWSVQTNYRVLVKHKDSIRVWAGPITEDPILTIPWDKALDGFDLPTVFPAGPTLRWGAFSDSSSQVVSNWSHVGYGVEKGQDIGVTVSYTDSAPEDAFDGDVLTIVYAEEE